jgi:hypothetical protein
MIDPTFKSELMDALHTAVDNYNHNPDPTLAVVKAARDHHFNMEQARRLTETFNTARTLYQYEKGEKTAHFPLADSSAVVLQLFKHEAPAEKAADFPDYAEYSQPETLAKAGSLVPDNPGELPLSNASPVEGMTVDSRGHILFREVRTKRALAEQAAAAGRMAYMGVDAEFFKVADWLRGMEYDKAVQTYELLKAALQDDATYGPVVQRMHAWMPNFLQPFDKRADVKGIVDDRPLRLGIEAVKTAQKLMEESCSLTAVGQQLEKEANDMEQAFVQLTTADAPVVKEADALASFFPKRAQRDVTESVVQTYSDLPFVDSSPTLKTERKTTTGGSTPAAPRGPSDLDKVLLKGVETLTGRTLDNSFNWYDAARKRPMVAENAKMTERLRNVQRQVLLQDLAVNDPIISEADPQTLQNTYSAVMQLAPEVSTNKEVMRAILRHAVHSVAISPFDASSWVELEKVIQDVQGKRKMAPRDDDKGGKK